MDAVVKRSGTDVFINIPKIVVGKMPWSEPPTLSGQQEKRGPSSDQVSALYRSRSATIQT
jgi:ureidoacrylate peracid hydrolase